MKNKDGDERMPERVVNKTTEKMDKVIEHLRSELSLINTGRANPQILSKLMVMYYGTPTPLNQVAQVGLLDAQTLVVTPYDKAVLGDVETSIQQANLGFNPTNDGTVLRIAIPPLTKERRQELVKQIKGTVEEAKVGVRNARRDGNDELKKMDLTADDLKGYQADIQELTNTYIKRIDEMLQTKETDIMTL